MSFDIENTTAIKHGFRIQVAKRASKVFKDWVSITNNELDAWVLHFREALSDPIPSRMLHRVRTPRSRDFPYMNSGRLRDSVKVGKSSITNIPTGFKYTITVDIEQLGAYYTNLGYSKPKHTVRGKWVGWADDVFGTRGRDNVRGLQYIFTKLSRKKRGL